MKRFVVTGLLIAGLGAGMVLTNAQQRGAGQRPAGERPAGERQAFDPDQMRQAMMGRIVDQLQVPAAERQAFESVLQEVMNKQRAAAIGRMGGMGAFGGARPGAQERGFRAGPEATSEVGKAVEALRQAVESPNTTAAQLQNLMSQVAAAQAKADGELRDAQENLRAIATTQQEARLVLMGLLPPAAQK